MPRPIGPELNDKWHIGAQQAFFSSRGTWFHRLERFPGALCDPNGFVRFETEQEYLGCPSVAVGKETNVRKGICRLAGYVQMDR
jgi:hypothetical protein